MISSLVKEKSSRLPSTDPFVLVQEIALSPVSISCCSQLMTVYEIIQAQKSLSVIMCFCLFFAPNALCSQVTKSFSIKLSIKPRADVLLSSLRCVFFLPLISKQCFQRGLEIAQLHSDAVSSFTLRVHVEAGVNSMFFFPSACCRYRFISSVTEEISHRLPTGEYIWI